MITKFSAFFKFGLVKFCITLAKLVPRHSVTLNLSPRICKFHLLQLAGGHHGDIRPSAALRSNQLGKHARERSVEIARAAGISAPLIRALCVPADRVHCVSVSRAGIGFQLTFLRRGSLARAPAKAHRRHPHSLSRFAYRHGRGRCGRFFIIFAEGRDR